jgi:hypothetical protein
MLVLFIYVTRLASNEIFSLTMKLIIVIILMSPLHRKNQKTLTLGPYIIQNNSPLEKNLTAVPGFEPGTT